MLRLAGQTQQIQLGRFIPTATCPIPDQASSQVRSAQNAVAGGHGARSESDCCPEELAGLVEHSYWITWSARSSTECGIVRPRALAVLRLITSSNFVACSMGRSEGLDPFKILST